MPSLICARLLGKKVVFLEPTGTLVDDRAIFQNRLLSKLWVSLRQHLRWADRRLAKLLIVQSWYEIEQGELQPYLDKVRCAPPHIDTSMFRVATPLEKRPLRVGFIGRLTSAKGIMEFLQAAALLQPSGISFCIIGDGDCRGQVETALQTSQYSHVEYIGWVDQPKIIQNLNEWRLLVLPTNGEGIPQVLLEAMACGTPVLSTAVGGIPDLIQHNVTGFILPNVSHETIAQSIQQALRHPELTVIAERGRENVIRNYSINTSCHSWQVIFHELTD